MKKSNQTKLNNQSLTKNKLKIIPFQSTPAAVAGELCSYPSLSRLHPFPSVIKAKMLSEDNPCCP